MPVRYHEGKFPPKSLDWERLAMPIERATMALSRYDSFLGLIPDDSIMLSPMLVQEAVTSSRIEGTHATMSETTSRRLLSFLKDEGVIVELIPHKGARPAILAFPRLLEITDGVSFGRPPSLAG